MLLLVVETVLTNGILTAALVGFTVVNTNLDSRVFRFEFAFAFAATNKFAQTNPIFGPLPLFALTSVLARPIFELPSDTNRS